jgi:hypothetical protein
MVTGAVPGLGKTTLCRKLVNLLNAPSRLAVLFAEHDILVRREFSRVIEAWKTGDPVPTEVLLDAAERYVATCLADDAEVFVQDMLFPFLPSLLAWGYSDEAIRKFCGDLADRCHAVDLVQIHLIGDARPSLIRAGKREGDDWLEQLGVRVSAFPGQEATTDLDGLTHYYRSSARRTQRLLLTLPWPLANLDVELGEHAVASQAAEWLRAANPGRLAEVSPC